MGNKLPDRMASVYKTGFGDGCEYMKQRLYDCLAIVLHDPDVMGKDTFGYERILKVFYAADDLQEQYKDAWQKVTAETDYQREQIDRALRQIYPPETCVPFEARYPTLKKVRYGKSKW